MATAAGTAIRKAIPTPRAVGGTIRVTGPVAGSATRKAIPKPRAPRLGQSPSWSQWLVRRLRGPFAGDAASLGGR
jgi:hypothetical protein